MIGRSLLLVTAPAAGDPVITRADTKALMRIPSSFTDDDTLIDALIATAVGEIDGERGWLNRALVSQTWDLRLDRFPAVGDHPFDPTWRATAIDVDLPPLQSVTSLKYIDTAGVEQTLTANTDYVVHTAEEPGLVALADGKSWPSTRDEVGAVRIRFVAGYGAAAAVPDVIKTALKLLVLDYYQNPSELERKRHADVELWYRRESGLFPPHVRRLLAPFRVRSLVAA